MRVDPIAKKPVEKRLDRIGEESERAPLEEKIEDAVVKVDYRKAAAEESRKKGGERQPPHSDEI